MRTIALGATLLDHSTSRVASPSVSVGGVPLTLIFSMFVRLCAILLLDQKLVRSLFRGTESMRMAIFSPLPVTPRLLALYAPSTSLTR